MLHNSNRGGYNFKRGYNTYRKNYRKNFINNKSSVEEDKIIVESNQLINKENINNDYIVCSKTENCPFSGWQLYFPLEEYCEKSHSAIRIKTFINYLKSLNINHESIETKNYALLDYNELCLSDIISSAVKDFKEEFQSNPQRIILELSLALYTIITNNKNSEFHNYVNIRIINFNPVFNQCNFKANQIGRFISVRGNVVKVSQIKPVCIRMKFRCLSCGNEQVIVLPDGYKFVVPTKCISRICKSKSFEPMKDSDETVTIDYQIIRLQESGSDFPVSSSFNNEFIEDNKYKEGRIPRTINCVLVRDLVDVCVPGDEVVVSGCVIVEPASNHSLASGSNCLFNLVLNVNSISRPKGDIKIDIDMENSDISEFSVKDLYAIDAIHSEPNLFRLLVASLCPSIYGHELVKASLLLALFGGVTKFGNDKNQVSIRGNSHVLIVGDPGLGKSQMLQSACAISPRSVYVCGGSITTAGLTVTFSKDSDSGTSLEAGALVISDKGCCCIDEFDKMTTQQHSSLLEAMEQQSISVAKAGMVCNLSARTSILAAANPRTGHYNKAKTVAENLKMSAPLLSRFDLVYIMLDRPNEVMDSKLSRHVLSLHTNKSELKSTSNFNPMNVQSFSSFVGDPCSSFQERLSYKHDEICDPVPPQLMRKYIRYAKKYVHPKLSPEAANILQEFYLSLRKRRHFMDGTPITTRQLESMVRLTEARARAELREIATEQDAKDVKNIMLESMMGVYSDEFGILNFSRSQSGSGMSKSSATKKLISLLQMKAERSGNSIFSNVDIKEIAITANINTQDVENIINSLNEQGFLLKKGPKLYKLLTAGF